MCGHLIHHIILTKIVDIYENNFLINTLHEFLEIKKKKKKKKEIKKEGRKKQQHDNESNAFSKSISSNNPGILFPQTALNHIPIVYCPQCTYQI